MFTEWATRRLLKFLIKKRIGGYIRGELDLEQLDVQLGSGLVQLNDLCLNTDYINKQLADSALFLKEGSVGTVTVKLRWKGLAMVEIELAELELVFSPRKAGSDGSICSTSTVTDDQAAHENQNSAVMESEIAGLASSGSCAYMPVQEGVRVVANLVESLLLGMTVRIKGAVIAFEEQEKLESGSRTRASLSMLVIQVGNGEYGVDYSCFKDNPKKDDNNDSKAAILSKAIEFKDVNLGLVDVLSDSTGSAKVYGQPVSILPHEHKLSGRIQVSIPWKSGCLDIPKLNADIDISDLNLWVTCQQIQYLLNIICSFGNWSNNDVGLGINHNFEANQMNALHHSFNLAKGLDVFKDRHETINEFFASSATLSLLDRPPDLLPVTNLISDWVHSNNGDNNSREGGMSEADFAASTEEFFDCFDGTRSSQASLSNSGLWTWTCSAFSAITAASSLASGSVLISQDSARQVKYEFKIKVSGVSFKIVKEGPDDSSTTDLKLQDLSSSINSMSKDEMKMPKEFLGTMYPDYTMQDHIEASFSNVDFFVQASQRCLECQLLVNKVELFEIQCQGQDAPFSSAKGCASIKGTLSSSTQSLQALLDRALPPFPPSFDAVNSCQRQAQPYIYAPSLYEDEALANSCNSHKLCVKKTCFLRMVDADDVSAQSILLKASRSSSSTSDTGDTAPQGPVTVHVHLQPIMIWFELSIWKKLEKLFDTVCLPSSVTETKEGTKNVCSTEHLSRATKRTSTRDIHVHMSHLRFTACLPTVAGATFLKEDMISVDLISSTGNTKKPFLSLKLWDNLQQKRSSQLNVSVALSWDHSAVYLLTPASINSGSDFHPLAFSAEKVISISMRSDRTVNMDIRFGGKSSAGVSIAERAWSGVKELQRGGMGGSNSEFAAATVTEVLEENNSQIREEMLHCSSTCVHIVLPPLKIDVVIPQHTVALGLIRHLLESLSVQGSNIAANMKNHVTGHQEQTSVLIEVEDVEISLHAIINDIPGQQREKYVPWGGFRISISKLQLLQVLNLGTIKDASYLWICTEGGNMSGSLVDRNVDELSLMSCQNDALGRGDGDGGNALATRSAGIELMAVRRHDCVHVENMLIALTLRGGTVMVHGGRLDWLPGVINLLSETPKEQTGRIIYERFHNGEMETFLVELSVGKPEQSNTSVESCILFSLDLHDVALCYEPGKEALAAANMGVKGMREVQTNNLEYFAPVACVVAAAFVRVSSNGISTTSSKEYGIWVRDVALLLVDTTLRTHNALNYTSESLHQAGYVKVAREAVMEAVVRTSDEEGVQWEVECANNQLRLDTCHDTTAALGRLIVQLQQLFAPDFERSSYPIESDIDTPFGVESGQEGLSDLIVGSDERVLQDVLENAFTFVTDTSLCEGADTLDAADRKGKMFSRYEFLRRSCSSDDVEESLGSSSDNLYAMGDAKGFWTPVLQQDSFSSFIEDHYAANMSLLYSSQNSLCKDSSGLMEQYQRSADSLNTSSAPESTGGWYEGHALNILENHVPQVSRPDQNKKRESLCHFSKSVRVLQSDGPVSVGRILLRDSNLRWRLYGGSDWPLNKAHDFAGYVPTQVQGGRLSDVCLEVILNGVELQHDTFPEVGHQASRLLVCINDVQVYDCSKNAPWRKILGYHMSKFRPGEASAKALKLELESVRPNPLVPLEEYRVSVHLSPLLLHLDQRHLDFLVNFFPSSGTPPNDNLEVCLLDTDTTSACDSTLLPFFQFCELQPFTIRVDYVPRRVDVAALRGGNYAELFNLVSWKGIDLHLKHVRAEGVHGWGTLSGIVVGEWLEDISQNQVHKLLKGLGPIRPLFAVGSGAAKLIVLPAEHYKRDKRHLLRGMKKGAIAFLRSISVETIGVGVKLAAGAQGILLHTESALGSVALPSPLATGRIEISTRIAQPGDIREGLQQACESLTRGLERTVSSLIGNPMKVYQRGAGTSSAVASALRAAPAAAVAPATAAAGAVHRALLGVRNSLDPEQRRESEEKHSGPPPD